MDGATESGSQSIRFEKGRNTTDARLQYGTVNEIGGCVVAGDELTNQGARIVCPQPHAGFVLRINVPEVDDPRVFHRETHRRAQQLERGSVAPIGDKPFEGDAPAEGEWRLAEGRFILRPGEETIKVNTGGEADGGEVAFGVFGVCGQSAYRRRP